MYILNVMEGSIVKSGRVAPDGTVISGDAVEVTKEVYDSYEATKLAMKQDGRSDLPLYIDGIISEPTDTRILIDIGVNKERYTVGENITITLTLTEALSYTGEKVLEAFGDLYLFNFTNGVAIRSDISMETSDVYEFKNNGTIKVENPLSITIVR